MVIRGAACWLAQPAKAARNAITSRRERKTVWFFMGVVLKHGVPI
jgi:hypothetical protein